MEHITGGEQHTSQSYNTELESQRSSVLTMGGLVEKQCQSAVEALVTGDVLLAEEVATSDYAVNQLELEISAQCIEIIGRDKEIDREFKTLTRLLMTHMMEQPQRVKNMLRVNSCARALERVGDHAVNLCEEVIYLVQGNDIRHLSFEEVKRRHQS